MRSFLNAPLLVIVFITLAMLVLFTVTAFGHQGTTAPTPAPYRPLATPVASTPFVAPGQRLPRVGLHRAEVSRTSDRSG